MSEGVLDSGVDLSVSWQRTTKLARYTRARMRLEARAAGAAILVDATQAAGRVR